MARKQRNFIDEFIDSIVIYPNKKVEEVLDEKQRNRLWVSAAVIFFLVTKKSSNKSSRDKKISNKAYKLICARFLEHPESFDEDAAKILGGKWASDEEKQQALWDHCKKESLKPIDIRTLKTKQL